MTRPTVYEAYQFLHGFPELEGKPVRLYYLETKRSLKWKKCSLWMRAYSEVAYAVRQRTMEQENWYSFKFVEEQA